MRIKEHFYRQIPQKEFEMSNKDDNFAVLDFGKPAYFKKIKLKREVINECLD